MVAPACAVAALACGPAVEVAVRAATGRDVAALFVAGAAAAAARASATAPLVGLARTLCTAPAAPAPLAGPAVATAAGARASVEPPCSSPPSNSCVSASALSASLLRMMDSKDPLGSWLSSATKIVDASVLVGSNSSAASSSAEEIAAAALGPGTGRAAGVTRAAVVTGVTELGVRKAGAAGAEPVPAAPDGPVVAGAREGVGAAPPEGAAPSGRGALVGGVRGDGLAPPLAVALAPGGARDAGAAGAAGADRARDSPTGAAAGPRGGKPAAPSGLGVVGADEEFSSGDAAPGDDSCSSAACCSSESPASALKTLEQRPQRTKPCAMRRSAAVT